MNNILIQINRVCKTYLCDSLECFNALDHIDLSVIKGECLVLKGVSGSGKSTLLSLIGAMSRPTSGEILFEKENIAKLSDPHLSRFRSQKVGFIFQSFNLIDDLTLKENLVAALAPLNLSRQTIESQIIEAMELAQISHKSAAVVKTFSGGEKQRGAIARALINNPPLIIADEPTANLDAQNATLFLEAMEMLKGLGKTILIATHDEKVEHAPLVDRILTIEYGKIV
jgi:putative ABC transport system ATP-binding protein